MRELKSLLGIPRPLADRVACAGGEGSGAGLIGMTAGIIGRRDSASVARP